MVTNLTQWDISQFQTVLDWFWILAMYLKLINLPENKLDGNASKVLLNSELIDLALIVSNVS